MKSIIVALIIMAVGVLACAVPEGTGYSGAANSGARLYITDFDEGGAITYPGNTTTWVFPSTVDLTFYNEPVNPSALGEDPSITLLSYDVEFFSEDPKAEGVKLSPYHHLPIYVEIPPFDEVELDNLPVIFPETWMQYYFSPSADFSQSIQYRVKITFHGQTEYGYSVKTFFNYLWLIAGS